MRIRIHTDLYWYLLIALLFVGQVSTGTSPVFALGVSLFALLVMAAFKAAGGLQTLPGICIVLFAGQQVLVSQVAKIIFGQPADTGLFQPLATIAVYDLSILGILLGILALNYMFRSNKPPIWKPETRPSALLRIAIITTVLSFLQLTVAHVFGVDSTSGDVNTGGLVGPLKTLTFLPFLAVASCTGYAIVSSGGRKCLFGLSYFAIGIPCLFGFVSSSRDQMISPLIVWIVTCLAFNYRIKPVYWGLMAAGVAFGVFILGPFALYARGVARTPNVGRNVEIATKAFFDVLQNPGYYQNQSYIKASWVSPAAKHYWYYGRAIPALDRLSLICSADGIVDATLNYGTVGWETITPAFGQMVPRFINPDKQAETLQNLLAHRTPGFVGANDTGTGIALGFSCDAFSSFGWIGVPVIAFVLTIVLFGGLRCLIDLRLANNIYVLAVLTETAWKFSDTNIADIILRSTLNLFTFALVLWIIHRVSADRILILSPGNVSRLEAGR